MHSDTDGTLDQSSRGRCERRLDGTNHALIELKRQLHAGESRNVIGKTVEKVEALLGADGASLVYAGYPNDPFAPDALKN